MGDEIQSAVKGVTTGALRDMYICGEWVTWCGNTRPRVYRPTPYTPHLYVLIETVYRNQYSVTYDALDSSSPKMPWIQAAPWLREFHVGARP
jgi:hypothetical protein